MDFWIKILSSAAVVSAVAYLVRFFGNIIIDQQPFHDDRKWAREISGAFFFANIVLVNGIIGSAIANYWGVFSNLALTHLFYFVVVGVFQVWFLISANSRSIDVYDRELIFNNKKQKEEATKIQKFFSKDNKHTPLFLPLSCLVFGYILTAEYLSNNPFLFLLFSIWILVCLVYEALTYSYLKLGQLPIVDIFFIGNRKPITNVKMIKYNEDNIRIRKGNEVEVVNKNCVLKVVFHKKEQELNK